MKPEFHACLHHHMGLIWIGQQLSRASAWDGKHQSSLLGWKVSEHIFRITANNYNANSYKSLSSTKNAKD